jgi:hypothetical protein
MSLADPRTTKVLLRKGYVPFLNFKEFENPPDNREGSQKDVLAHLNNASLKGYKAKTRHSIWLCLLLTFLINS